MAMFFNYANNVYDSDDTTGMYTNYYVQPLRKIQKTWEEISAIIRNRLALERIRSFWTEDVPVLVSQKHVATFAPRRTVVPRGIVSWVRMGNRRPI